MPEYSFECNNCGNKFSIVATYKEYDSKTIKCTKCQTKDIDRDYSTDLANMFGGVVKSDSDIKLGDLANRNRDRMSNDEKNYLYKKHNEYKGGQQELPTGMSRIKRGHKTKWT